MLRGFVRYAFMALVVTTGTFMGCGKQEVAPAQGGAGNATRAGEGEGGRSSSDGGGRGGDASASGSNGGTPLTTGGSGTSGSASGTPGGGAVAARGGAGAENNGGAAGDQQRAGAGGEGGEHSCGDLPNAARIIEAVRIDVDPPAPAGGLIEDGVYHLDSRIIYTGLGGPSGGRTEKLRATQIVTGGTFELIGGDPNGEPERRSGSYQVNGTNLVVQTACPGGTPDEIHPFTFAVYPARTTFNIYTTEGAEMRIETWVKQ